LDVPKMILDKYKGKTINNKLLPILSNQRMNSYLKEIGDVCEIDKELTFHLARHTFATIVSFLIIQLISSNLQFEKSQ
jgi:site-specific recombinase XerD